MCFFKKKKKFGDEISVYINDPIVNKMTQKPILNEDVQIIEDVNDIMDIQQKMYQDIVDILIPHLTKNWEKIALIDGEFENFYSVKFYLDNGRGYKDCFDLYDKTFLLDDLFIKIHNTIRKVRNCLPSKHKWNYFKMFINNKGKFEVDYEYNVDEQDCALYELNFAKKLKIK